jgi:hypothetical protein
MRAERFPGIRRPVQPQAQAKMQPHTFPAPVAGWVTNRSLVNSAPMSAQTLENFFPTATGIALRGGSVKRATIGSDPVESFITYNAGGIKRIWACDETTIREITSPADPTTPPAAAVSGQTSGYYSYVNFTTSGDSYVIAVNGTDPLRLYTASTGLWTAITAVSAPIAITGVSTSLLSAVWLYRNRLYFIEGGTMRAWYLNVDSIGGALTAVNLSGVFQKGGSLLFGGTWSLDAGDGVDDKIVLITTEGEAAIYEGSYPGGTDWSIVGRYELTEPMGMRATMRAGGDLIIATKQGMVPISQAIGKDAAALSLAAISRNIEPDWRREAARRITLPWEVIKWPEKNYAIVSLPIASAGQEAWNFVVNLETGAWCKFVGWPARCLELFNSRLYFGTNEGTIFEAEINGKDDGGPIYYTAVGNPDHLKRLGQLKTIHQERPTFISATPYEPKISFSVNYEVDLPPAPDAADGGNADLWDSGLWDVALWDQSPPTPAVSGGRWGSVGVTVYVVQWQLQITGFLAQQPVTEFVQLDVTYEVGGVVV